MYNLRYTNKIQRNIKLMKKRGKDLDKLKIVLKLLQQGAELPAKFNNELVILLLTTGSHSDLF